MTRDRWTTDETQLLRNTIDGWLEDGTCSTKGGDNGAFCRMAAHSTQYLNRDIGVSTIEKRYYGLTNYSRKTKEESAPSQQTGWMPEQILERERIALLNRMMDFFG